MMRLFKIRTAIILVLFLGFHNNLNSQIKNQIIAKIGNEILTSYDVENKIKTNLFLAGEEINQGNIDKIKELTLQSLINLKLKINEIKKYNLTPNQEAVNQYMNSISNNLNLSLIELANQFGANGISYDQLIKDIETEFLWKNLVAKTYLDKIKIDENLINTELNKILAKEKNDRTINNFNLSEIEIILDKPNQEENLINKINKSIKDIGFKKTAIKFSNSSTALSGGDLGWINSNQLSPRIYRLVQDLEIGDVSRPLKQGSSLLFLKINDKQSTKSQKIDVEKLRISLENVKKNELLNLYSNSHLSKIKNITLIEFL